MFEFYLVIVSTRFNVYLIPASDSGRRGLVSIIGVHLRQILWRPRVTS